MLAGGASSRMGRNKALLTLDRRTLVEIVAAAVREAAGNVTLIGPPEAYCDLGLPVTPDLRPNQGPLGGIETALSVTNAEWNLIVACDMPAISAPVLQRILDEAEARPESGCILPLGENGLPEPLCAAYHKRMLPDVSRALSGGIRKVTAAFPAESIVYLPALAPRTFENINTPDEWRRFGETR